MWRRRLAGSRLQLILEAADDLGPNRIIRQGDLAAHLLAFLEHQVQQQAVPEQPVAQLRAQAGAWCQEPPGRPPPF
jgi:hypothetical protein